MRGAPSLGTVSVSVFTQPGPDTVRAWDRLVDDTPGSDVAQLSAWSQVRRPAGFLPLYLLAWHDDRLVGGALVLQRHAPMLGLVGYLPYGPVIAPWAPRAATAHALCAALADLGQQHLGGLFVQPLDGASDVSDRLLGLGFRPSAAETAPEASIRIDLTRDVEDLRGGLTRSNRRGTRNWAGRGIAVRIGSERDLPLLTDLMECTAEHQNFDPPSLDHVATLYQELDRGGRAKVFIAELDGEPVVAELFTLCGGVLKSRLSGMHRSGPARKSRVAAALEWHALLWAKAHGYHTFDVGGLSVPAAQIVQAGGRDLASRLAGPEFFKASFGGRAFRYPAPVELISSPFARAGYGLACRYPAGGKLVATMKRVMRSGAEY